MSEELDNLFLSSLTSHNWKERVAEAGGSFIREKMRETSFARKILLPGQTLDDLRWAERFPRIFT